MENFGMKLSNHLRNAYRAIQIFEEALEEQNNAHKEEEAFQL
jgi:hypothetical protein